MIEKPRYIQSETIARLLADGYKVHSSAAGRVGTVKLVDKSGWVHIYNKNTGHQFVTRFVSGDQVELKQKDSREFAIVNYTHVLPQQDLFNNETEADRKFKEFDEKNPQVFKELVRLTWELKNAGHSKIGIQMLFEVIRWQSMLSTQGDEFKMNNNYAGRYARKIMATDPDLDGIFETRGLRS